jgi:hypothetical protein
MQTSTPILQCTEVEILVLFTANFWRFGNTSTSYRKLIKVLDILLLLSQNL